MSPRVSVLVPVYNVEAYIQETLRSLLRQTYQDFEIVVVNDRSTDRTAERIAELNDPRIRLVTNKVNLGRAGTDNYGMTLVRGELVAKMDGDDLCHPERLARQVAFLDAHPEVDIVGSWVQCFGAGQMLFEYPTQPADTRAMMVFNMTIGNPSVMLRTSLWTEKGLRYDDQLRQTEDYDFFGRYLPQLTIANLPEALVQYRVLAHNVRPAVYEERLKVANQIRERLLSTFGVPYSARELHLHNTISHHPFQLGDITLAEVHDWLWKIYTSNEHSRFADSAAMLRAVAERWFLTCYLNPDRSHNSWREYYRQPLARHYKPTPRLFAKFAVKNFVLRHLKRR
ncbi:glycosyltransferase family 2 protein [Hymenobacter chitinivorans]|uniref:Glycosyl transferase family 2 n=1 Tax=Hymenobacter chitinivorans DSM 11115 TaxID=1121954 RepID=A0A2M9BM25_9BACT|nr:glycosyltransferase family A protein [Hymenobacter chitinivorans]PJJ58991.1 glycosyl transferase family 2 [Hymenobacter chitinivorans DSM 11115]